MISNVGMDYIMLSQKGKTLVIAEMACAHEGEVDMALALVDATKQVGADIIQLQIFRVKRSFSPLIPNYNTLSKLELSQADWGKVFKRCLDNGLRIWATVFDVESLQFAMNQGVDGLKIHSGDISNYRLLSRVAKTNKTVSLGVGGCSLEEIRMGVHYLRTKGAQQVILMHGYQNFPTKPRDIHIRFINILSQLFNCPVGYMDHTDADSPAAFYLPLLAIGAGAELIEKHITLDRSRRGTDHESALNPDEFKHFVRMIRQADEAMGSTTLAPMSRGELIYRNKTHKMIVAARNIAPGEVIKKDMLMFMRSTPGGLSPADINLIVGKIVNNHLPRYTNVTLDLVE